jgi:2-oxoglutarate dehydrogenase E2 component (dihydrolipoamide succinyltransferase)
MRLAIAGNMQRSVTEAPHVTAVFEADFSAIIAHREAHKAAFAKKGVKLSYTAYLVAAAAEAMKAAPAINSRWHADRLELYDDINIGVGTALGSKGLIVPVLRKVQRLSLKGIAAGLDELIEKARQEKLTGADVKGGTFTISNHGVSGSLFAAPIIINQPQSAILGVGKLEKRVVVREVGGVDAIQIRPMAYVSLTIDHRVVDGHQTNAWLSRFVEILESWPAD